MILVTGAAGFIGSHLTEELVRTGNKIRVLVKNQEKLRKNLPQEILDKVEVLEGNLLDKESLIKATQGIKKIFHLAAIARPMNVPKHVYYDVNVTGINNLIEAMKENKVKKLIHFSTMSIFGYSRDGRPLTENSPRLPVSDYGKSKKQGEELVVKLCKENKIKLVVVRPPMVFGPRDYQWLKLFKIINTGLFPLLRKGMARFEFVYIKNLISAVILADKQGKDQEAYNINDGQTYTIKEVFSRIAYYENKKLFPVAPPVFTIRLAGWFMETLAKLQHKHPVFNSGTALWMVNSTEMDISKAKNELEYKQIIPIDEGIKETVNWYKLKGLL